MSNLANTQNEFRTADDPVASTVQDNYSKVLLSLVLPPMAAWYASGQSGKSVALNVVLCFFFYLPGALHAMYLCLKKPDTPQPDPEPTT